ncbi:MAG: 50S ribosomal protein L25 [bacterium]
MEELMINVSLRKELGKQKARAIRKKNEVPGVIYSRNKETTHISIPLNELKNILKMGGNELIKVNIKDDGEHGKKTVLLKDVQKHIVTDKILHVDFYEVFENQYIKTRVPVFITGKAKGTEIGGILQIVTRELNIRCLPTAIPKHIEIDVTNLNIGHTLHVRDIKPIGGVELIDTPETPVVHVMVPAKEEIPQQAPVAATTAEPEVIKKGKEAKEGEQPAEEAKETKQAAPQEKAEPKKETKKDTK